MKMILLVEAVTNSHYYRHLDWDEHKHEWDVSETVKNQSRTPKLFVTVF